MLLQPVVKRSINAWGMLGPPQSLPVREFTLHSPEPRLQSVGFEKLNIVSYGEPWPQKLWATHCHPEPCLSLWGLEDTRALGLPLACLHTASQLCFSRSI